MFIPSTIIGTDGYFHRPMHPVACLSIRPFVHLYPSYRLTHWSRVTHICVSKLTIFGSDNGLTPGRRQAIIWTNDGILLIGRLRRNFNEILIEIQTFALKKIHLNVSSSKCYPFCLSLNVLSISDINLEYVAVIPCTMKQTVTWPCSANFSSSV